MDMIIQKKYHFYAAHRNENLDDKCKNIHGHTYYLECFFKFDTKENGVTMLFSDIDKLVEPIIKQFDHAFIIHVNDPIHEVLKPFDLKMYVLDELTSCENLCETIFNLIKNITKLPITKIQIQETTSSIIIYEPKN